MGQVVYEDPIHHISGKISKKYRTTYNYRKLSGRKYTSIHGDRTTPLTARELQIRTRFTEVAAMVRNRAMDLSKLTQDQMTFIAQRNNPGGKKTMKAWYWMVCGQEYDQVHG